MLENRCLGDGFECLYLRAFDSIMRPGVLRMAEEAMYENYAVIRVSTSCEREADRQKK